jgi:hypothetical protein
MVWMFDEKGKSYHCCMIYILVVRNIWASPKDTIAVIFPRHLLLQWLTELQELSSAGRPMA